MDLMALEIDAMSLGAFFGALVLTAILVMLLVFLVLHVIEEARQKRTVARRQAIQQEQARIQADADQVGRHLAEQAFLVQREMLRRATEQERRHG